MFFNFYPGRWVTQRPGACGRYSEVLFLAEGSRFRREFPYFRLTAPTHGKKPVDSIYMIEIVVRVAGSGYSVAKYAGHCPNRDGGTCGVKNMLLRHMFAMSRRKLMERGATPRYAYPLKKRATGGKIYRERFPFELMAAPILFLLLLFCLDSTAPFDKCRGDERLCVPCERDRKMRHYNGTSGRI